MKRTMRWKRQPMQQMHKRLYNRKLEKIFIFISYIYVFISLYI